MGRENPGEGLRDGVVKGEKRSLRERLSIYQEVVRQREQDKQLADLTYKKTRGRSRQANESDVVATDMGGY